MILVSQRTAKRFWPEQNPIGKHVTLKMMSPEPRQVVGVVGEVKIDGLDSRASDAQTVIYVPARQMGIPFSTLFVRTAGAPALLTGSLVAAVHAIDPAQPVLEIRHYDAGGGGVNWGQRPLAMQLLVGFAALALILASVGIYSVLARRCGSGCANIGIRMALGAPQASVLRMVLAEGLKPTLMGVALGLALAALLVRVMTSMLYNVSGTPWMFALVPVIVIAVGLVATWIPAWRATRVDSIETLRAE